MKYFLLIISLIISGCASIPEEPVESAFVTLKTEVSDAVSQKLKQKDRILLQLGVIPSVLYGAPLKGVKWNIDLNEDTNPSLNMADFELAFSDYAETFNPSSSYLNPVVAPAETKMLRVSTFGYDAQEKKYLSGTLKDSEGNIEMLVYFDRACTITGELDFNFANEGFYNHQINIPEKGLYRLRIKGSKKYKTVTAHKSLDPIYVELGN